jgi:hypothetical protein
MRIRRASSAQSPQENGPEYKRILMIFNELIVNGNIQVYKAESYP